MTKTFSLRRLFLASLFTTLLSSPPHPTFGQSEFTESGKPVYPAGILAGKTNQNKDTVFLPLRRTDIRLHLTGGVLTSEVEQEFTNTSKHPLEAIYVFPLPSKATVTEMELRVGNRIIRSIVKEKEEAKKIYEAAKSSGRKAALVEQERPNIFTTSVANFQPGETVKIKLITIQAAEFHQGSYNITFPMVVGPRYIPGNLPYAHNNRITPPLAHPTFDTRHRARIETTIEGIPAAEITSNTHAIKVNTPRDPSGPFQISLRKKLVLPNCDFNLKIRLADNQTPTLSVVRSENEDTEYSLITLFPPTDDANGKAQEAMPRDVLFLIDTSGSMSGESIGQAKAGLLACLKRMNPQDQFTIVRFSDEYSSFSPDLRPADESRLEAGRSYINHLQSGGGTEMQPALQHTLRIPGRDDSMRLVVFLTDGAVGNEKSLLRLLDQELGNARLFTFGIGSAPNEFLMRKMAEMGRGQTRFIRSHEDVGEVMADFFKTLDSPVMTGLNLIFRDRKGLPLQEISYYPNPLPDIFRERPVQVVARYPKGSLQSIQITGTSDATERSYDYNLDDGRNVNSKSIGKLHGRAQINELMLARMRTDEEDQLYDLKRQIVETALDHQLVTQFTSRVAVEEQVKLTLLGQLRSVKVPTLLPRGWNPGAFFPTSTTDPLLILVAIMMILVAGSLFTFRKKA